ncbi:hypothetical protein D3C79_749670 [compost metagenome]
MLDEALIDRRQLFDQGTDIAQLAIGLRVFMDRSQLLNEFCCCRILLQSMLIDAELLAQGTTELLPGVELASEEFLHLFKVFGKVLPLVPLLAERLYQGVAVIAKLQRACDQPLTAL